MIDFQKTSEQIENGTTYDSGRPKRTTNINRKRISADERLVVDNKTYYKVEVMPSKLRSSGQQSKEFETICKKIPDPIPEESIIEKDDKGI